MTTLLFFLTLLGAHPAWAKEKKAPPLPKVERLAVIGGLSDLVEVQTSVVDRFIADITRKSKFQIATLESLMARGLHVSQPFPASREEDDADSAPAWLKKEFEKIKDVDAFLIVYASDLRLEKLDVMKSIRLDARLFDAESGEVTWRYSERIHRFAEKPPPWPVRGTVFAPPLIDEHDTFDKKASTKLLKAVLK